MKYLFLDISGMICAGCSSAIKTSLLHCLGVRKANVDHLSGHAIIAYEPRVQSKYKLIAVVENLGYQAKESQSFSPTQESFEILDKENQPRVNH